MVDLLPPPDGAQADVPTASGELLPAAAAPLPPRSRARRLSRAASVPVPVTGWRAAVAEIAARVVLAGGLWSLVSLVLRRIRGLHWVDDAFSLVNLPVSASLFSVVLLFVLGGALRRRIRLAFWVLLVFQVVALVLVLVVIGVVAFTSATLQDVGGGTNWTLLLISGAVSVVLIGVLFASRAAFPSLLERGARWRALAILVVGLAVSVAVSLALTFSFPDTLDTTRHKAAWAVRTALGSEPDSTDPGWRDVHGHHWVALLVGLLSALALTVAALTFLRSARSKGYLSAQDELDLRGLLLSGGERDSLGYFATRHDKSVVFDPQRRAAVTYRVVAAVSLASADPIGPPGEWRPAIEAWLTEARRFGWFPAVLSASAEGARAYVDAGLRALPLGDEAIVETEQFTLEGPQMQPIRRAVSKVQRAGYTMTIQRHAELTAEQFAQIEDAAQRWRGDDTERGFSMALNRIGDPADGDCVAVFAHDPAGPPARRALLRALGTARVVAGPDAPGPDVGERPGRGDGRPPDHRGPRRARDPPHLAELRHVPRRVQRRRAGRRRPAGPAEQPGSRLRLPVLAAGEPLPLQRPVHADLDQPLPLLRLAADDQPGRDGRRHR